MRGYLVFAVRVGWLSVCLSLVTAQYADQCKTVPSLKYLSRPDYLSLCSHGTNIVTSNLHIRTSPAGVKISDTHCTCRVSLPASTELKVKAESVRKDISDDVTPCDQAVVVEREHNTDGNSCVMCESGNEETLSCKEETRIFTVKYKTSNKNVKSEFVISLKVSPSSHLHVECGVTSTPNDDGSQLSIAARPTTTTTGYSTTTTGYPTTSYWTARRRRRTTTRWPTTIWTTTTRGPVVTTYIDRTTTTTSPHPTTTTTTRKTTEIPDRTTTYSTETTTTTSAEPSSTTTSAFYAPSSTTTTTGTSTTTTSSSNDPDSTSDTTTTSSYAPSTTTTSSGAPTPQSTTTSSSTTSTTTTSTNETPSTTSTATPIPTTTTTTTATPIPTTTTTTTATPVPTTTTTATPIPTTTTTAKITTTVKVPNTKTVTSAKRTIFTSNSEKNLDQTFKTVSTTSDFSRNGRSFENKFPTTSTSRKPSTATPKIQTPTDPDGSVNSWFINSYVNRLLRKKEFILGSIIGGTVFLFLMVITTVISCRLHRKNMAARALHGSLTKRPMLDDGSISGDGSSDIPQNSSAYGSIFRVGTGGSNDFRFSY